jgi:hypothetical protein
VAFSVSAIGLGHALQIANGFYHPAALAWVTVALALCLVGVLSRAPLHLSQAATIGVCAVMTLGIAWQMRTLLNASPGMYVDPRADLQLFRMGVVVQVALIAMGLAGFRFARRVWFPALLVMQFALGAWMLRASPAPAIDVVVVHREAIDALLGGHDPYSITFPNIYGADSDFYNPRVLESGRVMFGYPYPPLSLLLAVPGDVLSGDYRYAELAALVITGGLIGYVQPALTAKLAAALLLTTPRLFFVLEQGWTEPMALLMLALTMFCLVRRPALAPWAGGLALVTKQYQALAGPLLIRLARSARLTPRHFLLRAATAAIVVTVPFALWHPRAFLQDVVLLQMREPFRIDSLSYLSWAARAGWGSGSFLWSIGAGALGLIAGMARTPNTPAGFAASLTLSSLAMFAFGSKAFCNYYFYVVGAACCAIAAMPFAGDAGQPSGGRA